MRDMDFTKDGIYYQRINKTKARRLYDDGIDVVIYTVSANVHSMWNSPFTININELDLGDVVSFDKHINAFEYYNCNNEMGNYSKFYIKNGGIK